MNRQLPSYREKFGVSLIEGDASRSVYSPAAYLADLLQLRDDYFDNPDIGRRRGDIDAIPLDGETTDSLVPYLDIVNEVLGRQVTGEPFTTLKQAKHPFNLPFDLEHETVELLMQAAGLRREELFKRFQRWAPAATDPAEVSSIDGEALSTHVARLALGLPQEVARLMAVPTALEVQAAGGSATDDEIRKGIEHLRAYFDEQPFERLADLAVFIETTGLSLPEVRELLSPNLSPAESGLAGALFINHGLGGHVELDAPDAPAQARLRWVAVRGSAAALPSAATAGDGEEIEGDDATSQIPLAWFSRVNRLIRLSRQSGLAIADLDLMLRSCCDHVLDGVALQRIAVIRRIATRRDLPIDEVCGLLSPINALGQGDEGEPLDLFNRVFNVGAADLDGGYFQVSSVLHPAYADDARAQRLTLDGDLLRPERAPLRARLSRSLHLGERDLKAVITAFAAVAPTGDDADALHRRLSLYYRVGKLADLLDASVGDLLNLLDVLQKDPVIRQYAGLDLLLHFDVSERADVYAMLADAEPNDALWVTQSLLWLHDWMQRQQLSAEELKRIQVGDRQGATAEAAAQTADLARVNAIYQQLEPTLLTRGSFRPQLPSDAAARRVHAVVSDRVGSLVSAGDPRLIIGGREQSETAFYAALGSFLQVQPDDLRGLGLGEKLQAKIVDDLVLSGHIRSDGTLDEARWPATADAFEPCEHFDRQAVFQHIHDLYAAALEAPELEAEEGAELLLFPSDFEGVRALVGGPRAGGADAEDATAPVGGKLSSAQAKALYDNLIYNNVIDDQGSVLQPAFFSRLENAAGLEVNTQVERHKTAIYTRIADKIAAFDAAPCRIEAELFSALPLTQTELSDLIDNLAFNAYIDADGIVIDKPSMLGLDVGSFKLGIVYYPYRQEILGAIQALIRALKRRYLRLTATDFRALSDRAVVDAVHAELQGTYLAGDQLTPVAIALFASEDNLASLRLPPGLDASARKIVFKAIRDVLLLGQSYHLHPGSFDGLRLSADEEANLIAILEQKGDISTGGALAKEQVAYFLNPYNALDLDVPGYEDFTRDIFFVIHALAKRIQGTIEALLARYEAIAEQQTAALFDSLQTALEVPAELIAVICRHLFDGPEPLVEQLALPILAEVSQEGRVERLPMSARFRAAFDRLRQFAWLAARLDLDPVETNIVFRDQSLTQKFPLRLALPAGVERIDCLLDVGIDSDRFAEFVDAPVDKVLLLCGGEPWRYWLYDPINYAMLSGPYQDLSALSPLFEEFQRIDAAFSDGQGDAWLVFGARLFRQRAGETDWSPVEKTIGVVQSNFDGTRAIDSAFVDRDDRIYLLAGGQYLRSASNLAAIDPGYPRSIASNLCAERGLGPEMCGDQGFDAAFIGADGMRYVFRGNGYTSSADADQVLPIAADWGRVRNNFARLGHAADVGTPQRGRSIQLDAAVVVEEKVRFFAGDQCLSWSYGLDNANGYADEGSIRPLSALIPDLPPAFSDGVDAVIGGLDGALHILAHGKMITCGSDFTIRGGVEEDIAGVWGRIRNHFSDIGTVSAAFTGLDGCVYLFGGDQYLRYSSRSYAFADVGYPRRIGQDWGGLDSVDAAFVLDGKTYLIGRNGTGERVYVSYSSNDYTQADGDHPEPLLAHWWADHFNLDPSADTDFTAPDCVFIGPDGVTYLFKDDQYIAFDKLHRWWSRPEPIKSKWVGMPFGKIDAAFTGKDGHTHFFSGGSPEFIRYVDPRLDQPVDRETQDTRSHWGRVRNHLADTGRVDAALSCDDSLYIFSGDQFYRLSQVGQKHLDEGYPKTIAPHLAAEPAFANITPEIEAAIARGIDAAFADKRSVYLFCGADCHMISRTPSARYTDIVSPSISAVIEDDGVLYVRTGQGAGAEPMGGDSGDWCRLQGLETTVACAPAVVIPRLLRKVPTDFEQRLQQGEASPVSAAFVGADGATYVFKGRTFYNSVLEQAYLTADEWGRQRNNILLDDRVDAAFLGTDGRLYVFSGEQFVRYTPNPDGSRPPLVDDDPQPIAAHWGGLRRIDVAFVRDGKTYLLEATDDSGGFRYLCYSGPGYGAPDGDPIEADVSWWQMPSIYVEEGFDRVDAVLVENEHVFLFRGNAFVQFNTAQQLWSYPRPLARHWRGFPFREETGETLVAALRDAQGVTHFFSARSVTSTDGPQRGFSSPEPTSRHWGWMRNNIGASGRVDAAAVVADGTTYLFSGDQYYRYSSSDYRYVDDGYPKAIAPHLREEPAFNELPEDALAGIADGISGVIARENATYLFTERDCLVSGRSPTGRFPVDRLGRLTNRLQDASRVDAALIGSDGNTYLFCDDQYVRYSPGAYGIHRRYASLPYPTVDDGYPRSIAEHLPSEPLPGAGSAALAAGLARAINRAEPLTAAVHGRAGDLFLFQGGQVCHCRGEDSTVLALGDLLPTPENPFAEAIGAAFGAPDGSVYFLQDRQLTRYSDLTKDYADEGFPRAIQDCLGSLPAEFDGNIDAAFVFEDKTFLVRGDRYVRYSGHAYLQIDAIGPQPFPQRWGDWGDYLLSDLRVISDFKSLVRQGAGAGQGLSALLDFEGDDEKAPYRALATAFGWDIDEVKWLKRHNAFYTDPTGIEASLTIELIVAMAEVFQIADKAGTSPSGLYELARKDTHGELAGVSLMLRQWLEHKHSGQDWTDLAKDLHERLNLAKRDALLPYVISKDADVDNPRDLFAKLLIDAEMGSQAETSYVKEGIAALQLYFHRYLINLEDDRLSDGGAREDLRQWWQWMRNYRVWEANRKVFLYPENYLRPELREDKTPAFRKLEESLLQGEVTPALVENAFNDYLNDFAAVGNLRISGANVHDADGDGIDEMLVVFGRTRTEPPQHYYRTIRFRQDADAIWGNWLPVDIGIKSSRVFPVFAFGRIVVFWSEIEAVEESVPFIHTKSSKESLSGSTSRVEDTDSVLKHRADIKYSFYDFNKQWITPQTLHSGIKLEYEIDAAYTDEHKQLVVFSGEWCLTSTAQNPRGYLKRIAKRFPGLPTEFHAGIDAAVRLADDGRLFLFKNGSCAISSDDDDWDVRDIGSLFERDGPIEYNPLFSVLLWTKYIVAEGHYDAYATGVAAAFEVDGAICLVDRQGMPVFFREEENAGENAGEALFKEERIDVIETETDSTGVYRRHVTLINDFLRVLTRGFMRLAPVDAVFTDENDLIYFVRGGQYECYRESTDPLQRLEKLDGFPKPIRGNLSFDMDAFFHRLHVAPSSDDSLSLTYIGPDASTPLLSGRVDDDFTFTEEDERGSYRKDFAIALPKMIATIPSISGRARRLADVDALTQQLSVELAQLDRVKRIEHEVEHAWDALSALIEQRDGSDADSPSAPAPGVVARTLRALERVAEAVADGVENREALEELKALVREFADAASASSEDAPARLKRLRDRYRDAVERELEWRHRRLEPAEVRRRLEPLVERASQQGLGVLGQSAGMLNDFAQLGRRLLHVDEIAAGVSSELQSRLETFRKELPRMLARIDRERARVRGWMGLPIFASGPARNDAEGRSRRADAYREQLASLDTQTRELSKMAAELRTELGEGERLLKGIAAEASNLARRLREQYLGNLDGFPAELGIDNQASFTFGEPDWHVFEAAGGTFLCRPEPHGGNREDEAASRRYRIYRLTTAVIPTLSRRLFAKGIGGLLALDTQNAPEWPRFATGASASERGRVITYNRHAVASVPAHDHLDFKSANGIYYWEIFFHAPSLVAQALNQAQKFDDAKTWYELVFDPTAPRVPADEGLQDHRWRFQPFRQLEAHGQGRLEDDLHRQLDIESLGAEIDAYLNDPFDPHAIARIRKIAYQKATMMAYIDNLLDWGDMLFRQYTAESINEARMLYVLAYDLLGTRPAALATRRLPAASSYDALINPTEGKTDILIESQGSDGQARPRNTELALASTTVHRSVENPYFFIPDNDRFLDYWNRVEDRLHKIRQSLNIDGIAQALPLFQPPIDPLTIVQAKAGGTPIGQIAAAGSEQLPYYRCSFLIYRAKELVARLNQFGGELLGALEKRDAEQLALLQHRQEATVLAMVTRIKEAQAAEAEKQIASLEIGRNMVAATETHHQSTLDKDYLPEEIAQMSVMGAAVIGHAASAILRTIASFGGAAPDSLVGPFIAGIKIGGTQAYSSLSSAAEVAQTAAEGLSVGGEILGIVAQHNRLMADVAHQLRIAGYEKAQIERQLEGAQQQLEAAQQELAVHLQQIEHHRSVNSFMTGKFTSDQLYQWMSGQLSGLYYQYYKLAHDMAKGAEQAFQFERGLPAADVSFVGSMYWSSQRKGLLAGERLGLDIDRMEQAFIETDRRRLEISKSISLLELDPMAFLRLKATGRCELALSEALFDADFPGHYCRQIKTVEVAFDAARGDTVNATLTQLNNQTVLRPDPKAVKYLIDGKGAEPDAIRTDWRVSEQIALSHLGPYETGNGLFELRFDDERYLPFEGTGAVSRWRLELNGRPSSIDLEKLLDVALRVRYTALNGGEAFADAVVGLLKPYDAVRFIDLGYDFARQWLDFLATDERSLVLDVTPDLFPNMASSRITGIFSKLVVTEPGAVSLVLNNDESMTLEDERFVETPGLSVRSRGSGWTFSVVGDKSLLKTVQLVVGYKAKVS